MLVINVIYRLRDVDCAGIILIDIALENTKEKLHHIIRGVQIGQSFLQYTKKCSSSLLARISRTMNKMFLSLVRLRAGGALLGVFWIITVDHIT